MLFLRLSEILIRLVLSRSSNLDPLEKKTIPFESSLLMIWRIEFNSQVVKLWFIDWTCHWLINEGIYSNCSLMIPVCEIGASVLETIIFDSSITRWWFGSGYFLTFVIRDKVRKLIMKLSQCLIILNAWVMIERDSIKMSKVYEQRCIYLYLFHDDTLVDMLYNHTRICLRNCYHILLQLLFKLRILIFMR